MKTRQNRLSPAALTCSLLTLTVTLLSAPVFGQEGPDMSPAKELAKFEPLVGNWKGSGKMVEPTGVETAWHAHGSYRWVMNGHWLQEDFVIDFDGAETPMVFRSYWGWDRENERYVGVVASSEGKVMLNGTHFAEDGTMVSMIAHSQQGTPYMERARLKPDGDTLSMVIDLMMTEGDLLHVATGEMKRIDEVCEGNDKAGVWMGAPVHEKMKRTARMAGTYAVEGKMVMAPGQPMTKITGTDVYETLWGGGVLHARTDGHAEGMPEAYVSHAFWAWSDARSCIECVFVDNMGMVGKMDCHWLDENHLACISAGLQMGMPTTQRFVVTTDDAGVCKSGVGHTAMGALDPFLSFSAEYTKK